MTKVNAYQVAKLANVSKATVSRAINHREQVNPATLRQIDDAMEKLGFVNKKVVNNRLIIVNVQDLGNIFSIEVLNGINAAAARQNMHVLIDQTPLTLDNIDDFIVRIEKFHPYGIITMDQLNHQVLNKLNQFTRIVQCCEYNPAANQPFVSIDDFKAAYRATNYLITTNRRKLCLINASGHKEYALQRRKGFLAALKEHDLTINDQWLIEVNAVNYDFAYQYIDQLFASPEHPDAFLCVSDTMAAAVVKAADKYHLKVPADVSVIGFDNTFISKIVQPSLTTISLPKFQEGFSAVDLLTKSYQKKQQIILASELIVRQSTD